jgi:hypothetical protein
MRRRSNKGTCPFPAANPLFFTKLSNPDRGGISGFGVIKSNYLQDVRVTGALTGDAIVEVY